MISANNVTLRLGKKALFETAREQIVNLYSSKGFLTVPVEYEIIENPEDSTYVVNFSITEGQQTRIVRFEFTGNEHFDYSSLKKEVKEQRSGN